MSHDPDDTLTPDEAFQKLQETFADLSKIDTSKPRPWVDGMTGFMRPGSRALWFGAKGEGKSLAALVASIDVVAAGGSVTYIDVENGRLRMAERLDAILKDRRDDLREQVNVALGYADRFDFTMLSDPVVMDEARKRFGGDDLLVIDSLPRILGRLGLNESEPAHVQRFVTTYIDPLVSAGAAVLALDNTGHSAVSRPRGASSKEDLFELAYRITGGQTCSPTKQGTIRLHRTRHRDGDEFVDLSLVAGAGTYGSIVADDAPAKLLQGVVAVMKVDGHQSKNEIYNAAKAAGVKMRKSAIFKMLPEWAQDPDSRIIEHDDGRFGLEP